MKMHLGNRFLFPALVAALGMIPAGHVAAQNFTTIHSFTALSGPQGTNSDGANPAAGLMLSGNALYGTASAGGSSGGGTVFAVNTDGTAFASLHSFTARVGNLSNSDGFNPTAGLVLSGNALFGTAYYGGTSGGGTVFRLGTDGLNFTNLWSFTATTVPSSSNSDGSYPDAGLVLSGDTLYGTAVVGGNYGNGTVFAVNTDGSGFTNLHSFSALVAPGNTNSDGANPTAGLILSGSTLYGTAAVGGSSGNGTVFAVNTDGTGFTVLHQFNGSDGSLLLSGLFLSGSTLYGTTYSGGSAGKGTVFAVNTNGSGFRILRNFTALSGPANSNSDGANPKAGLILSGNTLYGTARGGGSSGVGTVFAINTDGTGFTNLHSFTALSGPENANSDGAYPLASLVMSGSTLYGTTQKGGTSGNGTLFSLALGAISPPQLRISRAEANVLLSWPINATGFTLQSTTNLDAAAVWTTNLPSPVVVNGQNIVTNSISGKQQFFRLSR